MNSFIKKFIPFSIVIAISLAALGMSDTFKPAMDFAWICYAVFFVLSIFTFYLSSKHMHGRFQNFMNIFFAGIVIKLFITGALVIIYKRYHPDLPLITFAVPFALIYFSFLIFETALLAKQSKQSKSQ